MSPVPQFNDLAIFGRHGGHSSSTGQRHSQDRLSWEQLAPGAIDHRFEVPPHPSFSSTETGGPATNRE